MIRLDDSILIDDEGEVSLDAVREALQLAIRLEHSTIPLYLYAIYSLDRTLNDEIVTIIRSAVIEEMLHMVLAANVLNAIGGAPDIDGAHFVPPYPCQLPGGVEGQLVVHLRPFSLDQLRVFIEIEEPREALGDLDRGGIDEIGSCTIGEFYLSIESALRRLPDDAFSSAPRNQVGPGLMFGSVEVTDRDTAIDALNVIIEQGEGTTVSPLEIDGPGGHDDLAHYYRFMQVHEGRRLVAAGPARFGYDGETIVFDPEGVLALPDDPRASDHAEGTTARRLVDRFNFTYTTLLGALDRMVNGEATGEMFGAALGLMKKLESCAHDIVVESLESGIGVGPSFEYNPIDPDRR